MILIRRDARRAGSMEIARLFGLAQDEDRARDRGEAIAMQADGRPAGIAVASKERLHRLDRDLGRSRRVRAQSLEEPARARLARIIEILMRDDVPSGSDRSEGGLAGGRQRENPCRSIHAGPQERARPVRARPDESKRARLPWRVRVACSGIDRVGAGCGRDVQTEQTARAKRGRIPPIGRVGAAIQECRDEAAVADGEPRSPGYEVTAAHDARLGNEHSGPRARAVRRFIAVGSEDKHPRPRHAESEDQRAHGSGLDPLLLGDVGLVVRPGVDLVRTEDAVVLELLDPVR